jgi:hypothetical protein
MLPPRDFGDDADDGDDVPTKDPLEYGEEMRAIVRRYNELPKADRTPAATLCLVLEYLLLEKAALQAAYIGPSEFGPEPNVLMHEFFKGEALVFFTPMHPAGLKRASRRLGVHTSKQRPPPYWLGTHL